VMIMMMMVGSNSDDGVIMVKEVVICQ